MRRRRRWLAALAAALAARPAIGFRAPSGFILPDRPTARRVVTRRSAAGDPLRRTTTHHHHPRSASTIEEEDASSVAVPRGLSLRGNAMISRRGGPVLLDTCRTAHGRRRQLTHRDDPRTRRRAHDALLAPEAVSAATGAVARLLALCGIGIWYARLGVLDAAACSTLSKLIFHVFQPAMLFTNCATTIATAPNPGSLAVLPACAALQVAAGALFGSLALRCLGPPSRAGGPTSDDENDARAAFLASTEARELRALCAFGNAGPLPFVFAQGFFRGDPEMLACAVAYISFYLVGWSPLFWTIGPAMLQQPVDTAPVRKFRAARKRVVSPPVLASLLGVAVGSSAAAYGVLHEGPLRPLSDGLRLLGNAYLPCVALVLAGTLARSLFAREPSMPKGMGLRRDGGSSRRPRAFWRRKSRKEDEEDDAQSHVVLHSSHDASATTSAPPWITSATPGSSTLRPPLSPLSEPGSPAPSIRLPVRLALLALCRFVCLPLASLLLLRLPIPALQSDPMIRFVVFMASAMPSAQNAVVILQLDDQAAENAAPSMAKLLALLYLIAIFPMAILLSLAAQIAPLDLVLHSGRSPAAAG